MPPILRGFRVAVPVCVSAAVSFLSLRCRLLDGSHYTRLTNVRQIKSTQTTLKPLQTLAFVGVSQPYDGDEKTADTTATATARHGGCDAQGAAVTATTDATQPRPRRDHDMHGHDRIQRNVPAHSTRHATPQANKHSSEQTFDRTHVLMLHIQQPPPWGSLPPGQKAGAACSLVLTLNARWNIFGLPVTYEVFTYLVVATVSAPYILCIMFLGLMLMVVERSSGPHRYLAAITHCA